MAARYCLATHVRVCVTEDAAIFMDLKRNAYVGLDEAQSRALTNLVEGWPCSPATGPHDSTTARQLAESLHERGLLAVAGSLHGRTAQPFLLDNPTAQLIEWDQMTHRVRFSHVIKFFVSLVTVALLMHVMGMERTVTRQRARRNRARGTHFNSQCAREVVSAFYHTRPFFYSPKGRCLLDTLVLLEFLSWHGIHAIWVVGVQTRPFAAHSWVQYGSYVLNGTPEYVHAYRPILVA